MYIDGNVILRAFAIITALIGIGAIFVRVHKWYLNLEQLEQKFEEFKEDTDGIRKDIREELFVHSYALLCMAKSMKAEGFNHTIDVAIETLEKHLNAQAHDRDKN